jgi:hypothetical protein
LAVLLKADKHGIIAKPYYLMLKTVAFNSWLERIGGRFRRGWLAFFDIGAAMGIGLLVFVIYSFVNNAVGLFRHSSSAGPTLLIIPLPGLTIGWDIFPYILLAIAVLLIPHEMAHGIASVLDKVPIKSSGVFMAVFLPVESFCRRIIHQRRYLGASPASSRHSLSARTRWCPSDRIHKWKPGTGESYASMVRHNSSQQHCDLRCPAPRIIPVNSPP